MKTLFTLLTLSFIALSLTQSATAQAISDHRVWIDTQQQNDLLTIRGKFTNDSPQDAHFRYELVTTKQGKSGSASSTQAGSFEAPAQTEVSLSNVSINITTKDTYVIELKIFRGDTVYLEDKIEYQG